MKSASKMTSLLFWLGRSLLLIFTVVGQAAAVTLSPGDIVVANSGTVSVIDPQTGDLVTMACCFGRLVGIAIDANGDIIVSDSTAASIIASIPTPATKRPSRRKISSFNHKASQLPGTETSWLLTSKPAAARAQEELFVSTQILESKQSYRAEETSLIRLASRSRRTGAS